MALALAIGCAACGDSGESGGGASKTGRTAGGESARGARLAFLAPVQNGYMQAMVSGAKDAAAKRGATVATVFAADGDPTKQIGQIKSAAASKQYDGRFPGDNAIREEVEAGLTSHPNVELVAVGEGMYQVGPARTATADMLSAHPGIDVIAANSDDMTRGAELAAQAAGKRDVKYIGVGASEAGCAAVRDGRWFATVNDVPRSFGAEGADGVLDAIEDPSKKDVVMDPLEASGYGPAFVTGNEECPAQWSN